MRSREVRTEADFVRSESAAAAAAAAAAGVVVVVVVVSRARGSPKRELRALKG